MFYTNARSWSTTHPTLDKHPPQAYFPKTFSEMTTIRELAKLSGVSVATVSRVFNDYEDVSPKTRERVLRLAAELDYTPTAAARTLVMQRSHLVGVVLTTGADHPDLQHPFFQEVLVALRHRLGESRFDLLLLASEHEDASRSYLRRCRAHQVDGVVLMGVDEHDPDIRKLASSSIACIAVDVDLVGPRAGYVVSDNHAGAAEAVRYLHSLGHSRIATITGMMTTKAGVDRLVGFRSELERLNLAYRDDYVQEGDFYVETGYEGMKALLALPQPPTAVFAASDLMAVGALRAAAEAGRSVPGDVSVIGFDDIQIARLVQPALTTIRQDKAGLGTAAAEAVIRLIEGNGAAPPVVTLPVELVVRASTGPVSTSGG
jgi:LacI family transcriptional regulator